MTASGIRFEVINAGFELQLLMANASNDEVRLIAIQRKVEEYLEEEAHNRGIDVELLIVEKLSTAIDPEVRKEIYVSNAELLLSEAFKYLSKGDLLQASEKGWGACASIVKAYGEKVGMEHYRHRQLEEIMTKLIRETKRSGNAEYKDLIKDWSVCLRLHSNFYEGVMSAEDVEESLNVVRDFVNRMREIVKG
ncbi:MAG: PaREP1 family protein [Thermoprotei archaeon]